MTNVLTFFDSTEAVIALPLADFKGDKKRIIGTATLIMPGLFLTSRHLIHQYMKDHDQIDYTDCDWDQASDFDSTYNLDILQPIKNRRLIVWHVYKIYPMRQSDLALLIATYEGDDDDIMKKLNVRLSIDLHMPRVGSRIVSLGYPKTLNLGSDEDGFAALDKHGRTTHTIRMQRSEGEVVFIETQVTQLSPRFQSNAKVDGGMSGGPVFNSKGILTGINSRALPPAEDDQDYASFAIPIFTAFNTKMQIITDAEGSTMMSLKQLAEQGYLSVKGLKHFTTVNGQEVWDSKNIRCEDCP